MTSHVDADTLALSAEGLLEDEQESSVRQHVAECADCAEQLTELTGVSRILAEVSAPPLPGAVIDRLDTALRAEAEERRNHLPGSGPVGPPAGGGGDVVPLKRRFGAKPWMPFLVAAAAAGFLLGGGAAVVNGLVSGDTASEPSQAAPEQASSGPDAALAYRPVLVESGTTYTEKDLPDQAGDVLGGTDLAGPPEAPENDADGSESPALPTPSDVPSAVSSCVHKLSLESGERPAMIDLAVFRPEKGADAEDVWVMYYGTDPGNKPQESYKVLVVSPECVDGKDPRDAVVAEATVPAP